MRKLLKEKDLSSALALEVKTIPFEYQDELQQNYIVDSFKQVLNSINFPFQILIQKQEVQHTPEVTKIDNEFLSNYRETFHEFLKDFIQKEKPLERKCYVIARRQYLTADEYELTNSFQSANFRLNPVELPFPKNIEIFPKHVKADKKYCRTIVINDYPRLVGINWLASLYNLKMDIDISLHIAPITDISWVVGSLKRRLGQLEAYVEIRENNGYNHNQEHDILIEDMNDMIVRLQKGEERFFKVGFYVMVKADSPQELNIKTRRVQNILNGLLLKNHVALLKQADGFMTMLPLGIDHLKEEWDFDSSSLSSVFPFTSTGVNDVAGILFGINTVDNTMVTIDRFSWSNGTIVVLGQPGCGKTFFVKAQIPKLMLKGVQVIVYDINGEYNDICNFVGGKTVTKDTADWNSNCLVFKGDPYETLEAIWDYVDSTPHIPKVFIVDEAWKLIQDERVAELLMKFARDGRKRYCPLTIITQNVQDFLQDFYGKCILDCAGGIFLLKIPNSELREVSKVFDLTVKEQMMLKGTGIGEGLLFVDDVRIPLKTKVSSVEYELITTNPKDLAKRREA